MELVHTFKAHTAMVVAVAIAPTADVAFSGSNDKVVQVYDLETLTVRHILAGHTDCVASLAAVSASQIISGSDDCKIRCWSLPPFKANCSGGNGREIGIGSGSGNSSSHSSDGSVPSFESGNAGGAATEVVVLDGHTDYILSLRLVLPPPTAASLAGAPSSSFGGGRLQHGNGNSAGNGDGNGGGDDAGLLISASCDTTIRIWSLATKSCLRVLANHSALISGLEL